MFFEPLFTVHEPRCGSECRSDDSSTKITQLFLVFPSVMITDLGANGKLRTGPVQDSPTHSSNQHRLLIATPFWKKKVFNKDGNSLVTCHRKDHNVQTIFWKTSGR